MNKTNKQTNEPSRDNISTAKKAVYFDESSAFKNKSNSV